MSREVEDLVKRALILSGGKKDTRSPRYPQELKMIVSDLIRNHGFSVAKTVSLIPVSHYSVRSWSKNHLPKKKKRIMFRKISLEQNKDNQEPFQRIKGVLYLIILLQIFGIGIISALFLR